MKSLEKFCILIIWPLEKILPINKLPELCVVLLFVLIFLMCHFILKVINTFTAYVDLSYFLVGLSLMVWGTNNIELVNLSIYVRKGEQEIGLIACLCGSVISLCLVLPIAALLRMIKRKENEL